MQGSENVTKRRPCNFDCVQRYYFKSKKKHLNFDVASSLTKMTGQKLVIGHCETKMSKAQA